MFCCSRGRAASDTTCTQFFHWTRFSNSRFLPLTANPAPLSHQCLQSHFPDHWRLLQWRGPPARGGRPQGAWRGDLHPGHLAGQHQGTARHGLATQGAALLPGTQLCRVWGLGSPSAARRYELRSSSGWLPGLLCLVLEEKWVFSKRRFLGFTAWTIWPVTICPVRGMLPWWNWAYLKRMGIML